MSILRTLLVAALVFLLINISGCGKQGAVVIENKSRNPLRIELKYDSGRFRTILLGMRMHKFRGNVKIDSIKKALGTNESLIQYLKDSVLFNTLFKGDNMTIVNLKKMDVLPAFYCNSLHCLSFEGTFGQYYKQDSILLGKLVREDVLSLYIPQGYTFINRCDECGDCSCGLDEAFIWENLKVIKADNLVSVNKNNFRQVFKTKRFERWNDAAVLKVED
jgi:hypothetical protein